MASSAENIKQEGSTDPEPSNTNTKTNNDGKERRRKRRWGAATTTDAATATTTTTASATPAPVAASSGPIDSKAKALALKESIRARLAALRSKTAASTASINKRLLPPPPPPTASTSASSVVAPPPAKRAKHYELDMTVTGPTFSKATDAISKPKPKINPYLAHRQQPEVETAETDTAKKSAENQNTSQQQDFLEDYADNSENKYVDARLEAAGHDLLLVGRKHRRRELKFVEPGTFVDIAERKRQRAANAESAGFASGRKTGQYFRSTTMMAGSGGSSGADNDNYYRRPKSWTTSKIVESCLPVPKSGVVRLLQMEAKQVATTIIV